MYFWLWKKHVFIKSIDSRAASIAKRVEYLVATLVVPGSIPGGSIEVLGELNSGDRI